MDEVGCASRGELRVLVVGDAPANRTGILMRGLALILFLCLVVTLPIFQGLGALSNLLGGSNMSAVRCGTPQDVAALTINYEQCLGKKTEYGYPDLYKNAYCSYAIEEHTPICVASTKQ